MHVHLMLIYRDDRHTTRRTAAISFREPASTAYCPATADRRTPPTASSSCGPPAPADPEHSPGPACADPHVGTAELPVPATTTTPRSTPRPRPATSHPYLQKTAAHSPKQGWSTRSQRDAKNCCPDEDCQRPRRADGSDQDGS